MTKVGKKNVVVCLQHLASYDFQKQAWLASSGPIVSSFTEDVCQLFNDTGLDIAMEAGEPIFGLEADSSLFELRNLTKAVDPKISYKILIDHPSMEKIREKAGKALSLIQSDKQK